MTDRVIPKVCDSHLAIPSRVYNPCIGCELDYLRAQITALTRKCEEAENAVWDELTAALQRAWPDETLAWNESPLELVTRLVDERDEARLEAEGYAEGRRLPWQNPLAESDDLR